MSELVKYDAVSLKLEGTFDDWEATGAQLRVMDKAIQFWLGDWLVQGQDKYGDRVWQSIHELGFADGTLLNYASICRQISPERRRAELPYSFHRAVAYLPQLQADKLLESAVTEHWTTRQLQERIKPAGGAPKDSEIKPAESESQGPPSAELWDLCLALVTARNERSEVRYNLARKLRDQLNEYLESFE